MPVMVAFRGQVDVDTHGNFLNGGDGIPDTNTMHQSHMCAVEEWNGNSVNW
jgi:hypothetical protein